MSLRATRLLASVRARSGSVAPVHPAPPDEHALAMLERARELGAPDPYLLLDAAEASSLLRVPLGQPAPMYADTQVGVTCAAAAADGRRWVVEVSVLHGDETGFDPETRWMVETASLDAGAQGLEGVAERAVMLTDGKVLLLVGERIATVRVTGPAAPAHRREATVLLARRVAARLAGADGG